MDLKPLIERWHAKADSFRPYVPAFAKLIDDLLVDLREFAEQYRLEALTLTQAADASGYSRDQIRRYLEQGKLENVGGPGAPRVRRGDLPRKAGKPSPTTLSTGEPDLAAEVLANRGLHQTEN